MDKKRQKILIVDDSEMNRAILADMLEDDYDILEAADGVEGVAAMQQHGSELSLVLLDIVMPNMDGFEVLTVMNQNHWIEDVPVIMVSAENSSTQIERAYEMGVTDFIMRPFDALIVRRRVVNTILLYAKQKRLIAMVNDQIAEKEKRSGLMIDILSHIVEFRNGESGSHILHVRRLTELVLHHLVNRYGERYPLTTAEISVISTASALHDIGKIAIPEHILNKPGRLTDEEFATMKTHSQIGASMLEALPVHKDDPLVRAAYAICRWHHERYDGRGYPDGLREDDIPIAAQVVALADVYDALTSERVYKKALPHAKALQMILAGECGAFNPVLMDCLRDMGDTIRTAMHEPETGTPATYSTAQELLRSEENDHSERMASERTLRLLEHERMKYSFYAALTEEIQFEYTDSPARLTLSAWGARRLGLAEIIDDPANDPAVQQLLGPGVWQSFARQLHAATPEKPESSRECQLHYGGEDRWYKVVTRSIWSQDEPPRYEGAIGKAMDIHDSHTHLEEIQRKASSDGLTHLLNRASAQELITERLLANPDGCYAMALFDLDHLKTINDQHGHGVGDKVLRWLAQRLEQSIRGRDISARAGGDEFLLFLEYKPGDDIQSIVQRIFANLSGTCAGCAVSVSMGVACSSTVGADYEALFHAADKALYSVKRGGRGHCCFYDVSMQDMFSAISAIETGDAAGNG